MLAAGSVRWDKQGDVNVTTLYSANRLTYVGTRTKSPMIKPLISALAVAVTALALAGCESGSNILSGGANPAPQAQLTPPPQAPIGQLAKIKIEPIIGSPENIAHDLQGQLASSIERNKLTVSKSADQAAEYSLRGYIVAAREKTGSKVSYIFDVTDKADKRVNRVTGEEFAAGTGKDPWATVTPQVIQSIADKTATQIASWLPGSSANNTPVASATPTALAPAAAVASSAAAAEKLAAAATPAVADGTIPKAIPAALTTATGIPAAGGSTTGSIQDGGPVMTMVPSVTGAPGDGSATLTSAIQRELGKNGVALTQTASAQTYKVEGKVVVGQGKDGKQPIQIDWNVLDPAGKKLGTVSQKNEVPQGSLDGAWGKTADAAAAAAAQGILKLLPQQKAVN